MKKGVLAIGAFTACIFIGVGFLSGKETALFFLPYKNWVWGLILNAILTGVFSFIIITYFQRFSGEDKGFEILGKIFSFLIIIMSTVTEGRSKRDAS